MSGELSVERLTERDAWRASRDHVIAMTATPGQIQIAARAAIRHADDVAREVDRLRAERHDPGLHYCTTHHGVRDVDQQRCDNFNDTEPCSLVPLFYTEEPTQ